MKGATKKTTGTKSSSSPFEDAQCCVFWGKYIGLEENKDYKTLRAVFEVDRDRVCNQELLSYFDRMRQANETEEKAKGVKVIFLSTSFFYKGLGILFTSY